MSEDDNDILKRLRSVRKKLQESLDDTGKIVERQDSAKPKVELVDNQRQIELEEARRSFKSQGDRSAPKGPKLYESEADRKARLSNKEFKQKTGGISRKRMAAIQRRIKKKVEERRGLSPKRKVGILAALIFLTLPLFMTSTLALTTCRFDFNNVGIKYNGTPGYITLTLPVYNPSFLPAKLGQIDVDVYAKRGNAAAGESPYYYVGTINTRAEKTIAPFTTIVVDLNLVLDKDTAGVWLRDLFNTMTLELVLKNFRYNGVNMVSDISIPPMDLSGMVADLTSGFSLDSMAGGFMSGAPKPSNVKDLWSMAGAPKAPSAALNTDLSAKPNAAQDYEEPPSFELLDVGLGEDDEKFQLKLDAAFYLDPMDNYDLGPIRIMELNTTLYGPGGPGTTNVDTDSRDYYQNPIASLTTWDLSKENVTAYSWVGNERNTSYPVEINFGSVSYAAARLTVYKDDIDGASTHPSAYLNFSDPEALAAFEEQNKTRYPMWYFLNNLLAHQMIDSLIRINKLSIEIFGIQIKDIQISEEYLPILKSTEPLFNIDDLVGGMALQPMGFMMGFDYFTKTVMTFGMNNPKASQPSLDVDALGDMVGDINTDDLLSSLKESWGEDANISLGLGINIDNTMIDLHFGMRNLTLGIANSIPTDTGEPGPEKMFAYATATDGDGNPWIYLNGINTTTVINLNLTLMKNEEYAPYVAQFLRDLIESFTLKGTAILNLDYLMLFKENYTFAGIKVALGLDALGLDLESLLQDTIRSSIQDSIDSALAPTETTSLSSDIASSLKSNSWMSFSNPLTDPITMFTMIMLGNPILSPATGISIPNVFIKNKDGSKTPFTPQAAQDIFVTSDETWDKVVLHLSIEGLELDPGMVPIHLGLGYTTLQIETNSSNTYGEWDPLIGITLYDYTEINPDTTSLDLNMDLTMYKTDTLCSFLDAITDGRDTPSFSMRLVGSITLNFSGVYIPDMKLNLEIPDIYLSVDLQGMIDSLTASSESLAPGSSVIGPLRSLVEDDKVMWWNGDMSNFPLSAQNFDIGQLFDIGSDFQIIDIGETDWPYVDKGMIYAELTLPITNKLMDIELIDPKFEIYADDGTPLANLTFMNERLLLEKDEPFTLHVRLELYKSLELQNFLNTILWSLEITGKVNISISIKALGCTIGPLTIAGPLNDILTSMGMDIDSLLGLTEQLLPFNEKTLRDSPKASQDMMDLFGNFGIAYVTTKRNHTLASGINPVGPLNYDDPMFTVIVGLALQPGFNMSILDADLYLCDGEIYNLIYQASGGDREEAIKYSKIARISMNPFPVYANNTYDPNTDFSSVPNLPDNFNESRYFEYVDPNKPYYDQSMLHTGPMGLHYYTDYNSTGDPIWKPYKLGTFAMTELELSLYNISHGTYDTAYPKKYWRAMGGPYFPVQVFDKEHGGYPDHRYVYHPHYSPLANLLSNIESALDDPNALLSSLAFGGTFTMNVFSMNITLDASSPAVSSLMTSLTTEAIDMMMDQYRMAATPWAYKQSPQMAMLSRYNRVSKYDDPSIPRYATSPQVSEFYTDMAMDMEAFVDDYPYIGLEIRNDHIFAPGAKGESSDHTIHYMNDSRDMGSNINPYTGFGTVRDDYKPGLVEYGGDNREHFVKDQYYEEFKITCQNYADAYGILNPYFESENLTTYDAPSKRNGYTETKDIIENPKNWAIRWDSDIDQRIPTVGAIYINGFIPSFELGLLSAKGTAWNMNPAPGKDCGALYPIGYVWINSTLFPPVKGPGLDDNFWQTQVQWAGNGMLADPNSSWIPINMRLFRSLATMDFVEGLANVEDFNLNFYVDLTINISLFGYEAYGLAINKLSLGGQSKYEQRCSQDISEGATGSVWGIPNQDGTVEPPSEYTGTTPEWLPEDFLPQYETSTYQLDINMIFNDLSSIFSGDIFTTLGMFSVDASGISITLDLPLVSPLTLGSAWITYLEGSLVFNQDQVPWDEVDPTHWKFMLDLGDLGDIWREIDLYWDESVPGGFNTDPYNIGGDMLGFWPAGSEYAGQPEIQYGETITLPDITITITWQLLDKLLGNIDLNALLWKLATGGDWQSELPDYLWVTLLKDRFQLMLLNDPYKDPVGGLVHLLLFPEFGGDLPIEIPYDMVIFNLMDMIK